MNYKKTILKTILYTLLVLVCLTAVAVGLMFGVFTSTTANIVYDLGCDELASKLYYQSYEKKGNIEWLYKALNIEIKLGNNENIVDFYNKYLSDDEYEEFAISLVLRNENAKVGVLEKSSILNEENYLENNYIRALVSTGDRNIAFDRAVIKFEESRDISLQYQGVYALGNFVSDKEKFAQVYNEMENTLIVEMQEYFGELVVFFNGLKEDNLSGNERAYLVALGNRIINLGKDINSIYSGDTSMSVAISENLEKMNDVNDVIKGLL